MIETTSTTSTTSNKLRSEPRIEDGWHCPRCNRINAPWVRQCDCSGNSWTITCDDTTAGDEWWKKYVTCTSDTFKIHPDDTVYTAVDGSDYWDNIEKIWSNVFKNVNNKKEK